MGKLDGPSSTAGGILRADIPSAMVAATHVAVGAGWGDGAVTKAVTADSNTLVHHITITSVGSNQAQATATVTVTFPDVLSAEPRMIMVQTDNDNALTAANFKVTAKSATGYTMVHSIQPVATKIYNAHVIVIM